MSRLKTPKTYKAYLNGEFVRSESGRHFSIQQKEGNVNLPRCSSKDVRNACVGARKAFDNWSARSHFNRSQILYRIAEMMEASASQLMEEQMRSGSSKAAAESIVYKSIDRCIYYAGWCDKFPALIGTINPVSSSHFNFSVPEPMGVVGIITSDQDGLFGMISTLLPAICGGNTCVVLVSKHSATVALTFGEVLNNADVPGGVVQLLSGERSELAPTLSSHLDVNAISLVEHDVDQTELQSNCATNVKRFILQKSNWEETGGQGLEKIRAFQEIKTVWHPIESTLGGGGKY